MATSTQEAYLVLRAQCGDREAFERLITAVHTAVIQLSMTRMTRMVLRAIELTANGSSRE